MNTTTETGWYVSSDRSLVRLVGEIDLDAAPRLRRVLERAAADSSEDLVVDLSDVTFLDCSGLAPLLEAKNRLKSRLTLQGVPQRVLALLRLTDLQAVFGVNDETASISSAADRSLELLELEEQVAGRRATARGRSRIDQARGLVMATRGCDAETAWQMLFQTSREQDVQVHDLADALVRAASGRDTGQSGGAMMIALQVVMGVQPGPIEEVTPSPQSEARQVR
ncbi:MAG TPA: anti-sigma factor antagonist [Coriobacteriia bacterium]|nr:anti-sigma factor antagonist [Coriobacteriia bacterium]